MSGPGPRDTTTSSLWVAVSSVDLPDKKYFKIGEVAQLVGVEPHVLRYWQTQFPQVRPQKSRSGHRLYRRRDVETLLAIRELLHVQRFTIAGARQALRSLPKNPSTLPGPAVPEPAAPTTAVPQAAVRSVDAYRALTEQRGVHDLEAPGEGEVELFVEALDNDALAEALSRQLAEARGADVEAIEIEAEEAASMGPAAVRVENAAVVSVRVGAQAASLGARGVSGGQGAGTRAVVAQPVVRQPLASEPIASQSVRQSNVNPPVVTQPVATPAAEVRRPRRRGEQLGFGFLPSSRSVLEAARVEMLAILEALERDEAESRRRLSGAPTSRAFES